MRPVALSFPDDEDLNLDCFDLDWSEEKPSRRVRNISDACSNCGKDCLVCLKDYRFCSECGFSELA
ncbi:MAG: hypothetical protein IT462_11590 [Planctomycetes bacterium]|nr:hypothetical protein [Planctomycetota bacterium]